MFDKYERNTIYHQKDHQKILFRPHNPTLFNIWENEYIYNAGSKGW